MPSDELSGRDEEDVSETFVPLLVSVFSSPPQAAAIAHERQPVRHRTLIEFSKIRRKIMKRKRTIKLLFLSAELST